MTIEALELFPAIDVKEGRCVRLVQGDFDRATTFSDDPAAIARRWASMGARWLHVVDLDGARLGRPSPEIAPILRRISEQTSLPIQFGGGVRSEGAVEQVLSAGVARVVVGTAVATDAALAERLFREYGERVAVAVDARDGIVAIAGWQEQIGEKATDFMARMRDLGARRFIFTDIARDGMLQGINREALLSALAAVPDAAVIASGGVATIDDVDTLVGLRAGGLRNLEGVIIGKALYTGGLDLHEALVRASAPGG
jgi:phosphoribosylformimino-5-aminoimidazole carboxamide ribotide isomerase